MNTHTVQSDRSPGPDIEPIFDCLCGRPHPCPQHGAWAQPVHQQLGLPGVRR